MSTILASPTLYPCGHPRTGDNTIRRKRGQGVNGWCRTCHRARGLAHYHAHKANGNGVQTVSEPQMARLAEPAIQTAPGPRCISCDGAVVVKVIDGRERRRCSNCGIGLN